MRKKIATLTNKTHRIRWRSNEPSRMETFSDAVMAFALTLIIVSIEVPKSFDELTETMKGTVSFAVCFALLFQIWNNQNIFFRHYGLKDAYTNTLNAFLLFVVLIYAYPLKFLSMLMFASEDGTYVKNGHRYAMIKDEQVQSLMLIYGAGFFVIYLLFYLMYRNAQKQANELELSKEELFETITVTNINLICMIICIVGMLLAFVLPKYAGPTGFIYCLIPLAYTFWYSYRGGKQRKLFATA
ncbi:TMEM175 family protein [Mucilaginibacter aquaedulcis]|uniref:TMEM175 family protein n=1 Tax=Mucilaginibacter aquaedulcis TaxID=1187081 RepID=UPI0025B43A6C|nr:TMEM175 family protein [Mucilaginibacter aquaedulcis]MDN3549799.1 TMEM175 family protein [Mucilaginibacter aquaedulcis]